MGADGDRVGGRLEWLRERAGSLPPPGAATSEAPRHGVEDGAARTAGRSRAVVAAVGALVMLVLVVLVVPGWALGPSLSGGGEELSVALGTAEPLDPDAAPSVAAEGPSGEPGTSGAVQPSGSTGTTVPVVTGPLVVHVDGAVVTPGVVQVPAGSRVGDAVAAAGGLAPDADSRRVNLARLLSDGELVVVPRPGEPDPTVGGDAAADPGGGGDGDRGGPEALVDLNTAGVAELDALPGIGPALAGRIVAWREDVGPFRSVDDLDQVSGIGPTVLEQVRALATV